MSKGFRVGRRASMQGEPSQAPVLRRPFAALTTASVVAACLAGCGVTPGDFSERANKPLTSQLLAQMQEKGMAPTSPVLIRAFKKEAEVEIWKMKPDGHYALFKSYPICRWSGQLGPKTKEGDRQVPEGFYTITPSQMNPRSAYYLSFNVGYPNAYDQAHGYTGGEIMVHGVCSSAGCFSMTDQQIAEIYAVAREAFVGGQQAIQFESFPFHMTPENLAKYRLDPNIAFWKELKVGYDNFEVTKQEVAVGVCNYHYVFNAVPGNGGSFDPTGVCPPLKRDQAIALAVSAKQANDEAKAAALAASGVRPVHTVYADGGQNAQFSQRQMVEHDVSRPEALAAGPIDVPLDQNHRYKPLTKAQIEAAKERAEAAEKKAAAAHAYAYADSPPPEPQQSTFGGIVLPNFGQSAQATKPQSALSEPAPAPIQGPKPQLPQWSFIPGLSVQSPVPQQTPAPSSAPQQVATQPDAQPTPAPKPTRTRLAQDAPPADTMWPKPARPGINLPGLPGQTNAQGASHGTQPGSSPLGPTQPPAPSHEAPPADTMWPQPARPGLNIPGLPQAKPKPQAQPTTQVATQGVDAASPSQANAQGAAPQQTTVSATSSSAHAKKLAASMPGAGDEAASDAAKAAYAKPIASTSGPNFVPPDFSAFSGSDH